MAVGEADYRGELAERPTVGFAEGFDGGSDPDWVFDVTHKTQSRNIRKQCQESSGNVSKNSRFYWSCGNYSLVIFSMCFRFSARVSGKGRLDVSICFRQYVGVSTDGLERLGNYVVARRVALGYRNRVALANELPITDRTLADVENGDRNASAGTYALIEAKLKWKPGSIASILDGGEPFPEEDAQTDTAPPSRLAHVPTDELLAEVRSRIIADEPQPVINEFIGVDAAGVHGTDHRQQRKQL